MVAWEAQHIGQAAESAEPQPELFCVVVFRKRVYAGLTSPHILESLLRPSSHGQKYVQVTTSQTLDPESQALNHKK